MGGKLTTSSIDVRYAVFELPRVSEDAEQVLPRVTAYVPILERLEHDNRVKRLLLSAEVKDFLIYKYGINFNPFSPLQQVGSITELQIMLKDIFSIVAKAGYPLPPNVYSLDVKELLRNQLSQQGNGVKDFSKEVKLPGGKVDIYLDPKTFSNRNKVLGQLRYTPFKVNIKYTSKKTIVKKLSNVLAYILAFSAVTVLVLNLLEVNLAFLPIGSGFVFFGLTLGFELEDKLDSVKDMLHAVSQAMHRTLGWYYKNKTIAYRFNTESALITIAGWTFMFGLFMLQLRPILAKPFKVWEFVATSVEPTKYGFRVEHHHLSALSKLYLSFNLFSSTVKTWVARNVGAFSIRRRAAKLYYSDLVQILEVFSAEGSGIKSMPVEPDSLQIHRVHEDERTRDPFAPAYVAGKLQSSLENSGEYQGLPSTSTTYAYLTRDY